MTIVKVVICRHQAWRTVKSVLNSCRIAGRFLSFSLIQLPLRRLPFFYTLPFDSLIRRTSPPLLATPNPISHASYKTSWQSRQGSCPDFAPATTVFYPVSHLEFHYENHHKQQGSHWLKKSDHLGANYGVCKYDHRVSTYKTNFRGIASPEISLRRLSSPALAARTVAMFSLLSTPGRQRWMSRTLSLLY